MHVVGALTAEEGGRCACGARFWVEGPGDEGEPGADPGAAVPEGAQTTWVVEPDGTTRTVHFF